MKLRYKLILAAASGAALPVIQAALDELFAGDDFFTIAPGIVFAAGVLFPFLRRDRWLYLRAAGAILLSIGSYTAAINVAASGGGFGAGHTDLVSAGVVGAAIVFAGTALLAPLRVTAGYVSIALTGSLIAAFGFLALSDDYLGLLSYVFWHTSIAATMHFASPSTEAGARLAARFPRLVKVPFAVIAAVVALAYVDFWIGERAFEKYPKPDAGSTQYRTVRTFGYLNAEFGNDRFHACDVVEISSNLRAGFAFFEVKIDDPSRCAFPASGGYQHFYLSTQDDPACVPVLETSAVTRAGNWLEPGRCIAVRATAEPISDYVLRKKVERVPMAMGLHSLEITRKQVVESASGTIAYEDVCYLFAPRPGSVYLPGIAYSGDPRCRSGYAVYALRDVVLPADGAWIPPAITP